MNVHGTSTLIFSAVRHEVRNFVRFSTNGVYQFREHGVHAPVSEDYPTGLSPHNSYGNSKAIVECLLNELTMAGKIRGRVLRPGEIYGPVMSRVGEPEIYWKSMLDAAIHGREFTLDGHPEHRLDWVYAKDVARAAVALLLDETQRSRSFSFNVSYGTCMGVYDIKGALDRLYPDTVCQQDAPFCEIGVGFPCTVVGPAVIAFGVSVRHSRVPAAASNA